MTMRKRIGIATLAVALGVSALALGGRFSGLPTPGFVSTAWAYVDRTMSPVRVQGIASPGWGGCIPSIGGC